MSQATGRTRTFPDVVPADPALRRRALHLTLAAVVPGAYLAWRLERWLLAGAEIGTGGVAMGLLAGAVSAVTFAAGVYAAWVSMRILRARRFPAPGMRAMRDTPVRIGTAARVLGLGGLFFAAALLVAAAMVPLLLARVLALP